MGGFRPNMFKLKDRNDRDFCLGPTHEEILHRRLSTVVRSIKEYPDDAVSDSDKIPR